MLFDARSALAEILAMPCDTRDTRDKSPEKPSLSRMSQLSQGSLPKWVQPVAQPAPSFAERVDPEGFPYGIAVNGYPFT